MQPMSPEDRELEALKAGVSAHYRAGAGDEPSARVDAAVLEAARRDAQRSRIGHGWKLPASIAAVLVIGVSLALVSREIVEPLPPPDRSARQQAQPAAPSASREAEQPKTQPMASVVGDASRPSRERGARPARGLEPRQPPAPAETAASVAPAPVAPAAPAALQQLDGVSAQRQAADASAAAASAPADSQRKEAVLAKPSGGRSPEAWLKQIEALLDEGRTGEASAELAGFRKRYPDYRLPRRLLDLSPAD
jgi:hypothetical protein